MSPRLMVFVLLALSWLGSSAFSQSDQIRKDRILVKFKAGTALTGDERPYGKVVRRFDALGIEVIQIEGAAPVEQVLAAYKADPRIIYAQPDHIRSKQLVPNDPGTPKGDAWHQHNDGRELGSVYADITARAAWDIRHDAEDVVVAVLDTGIRYTHEDLVANMWKNTAEANGQPGVDDDGDGIIDDIYGANLINNTGVPMDDEGHGTFVAGLIGAVGDNGKGVTGICWRVKLMAVKVLDSFGRGTDSDIIAGMEYARQRGAKLINASLGRVNSPSPAIEDAIAALATDGVILVAAAGNDGADNDFDVDVSTYPATSPQWNVVSVAATTRNDLLATFSNYGWRSVDIGAPGVDVPSTSSESDTSYDVESGTSIAAPIVTGALALLTAQTPFLTPIQRVERLLNSVDPVPALSGRCLSGGRLNLVRALAGGSRAPVNDSFSHAIPLGNDVRFTGSGVTAAATVEPSEPISVVDNDRRSLWFTWTAPFSGKVKMVASATRTPGNSRRAIVTVFQGSGSFSALQKLGTNLNGGVVSDGPFFFDAKFGQQYSISLENGQEDGSASGFFGIYDLAPDGFGDYTVLSVDLYGAGTVTPASLLGESIQRRGRTVTLKAKPAPGYILYGWVDPTVDDIEAGILSRQPTYTVSLQDKGFTAVEAVFAENPFRELKGRYNGLATLASGGAAGFLTLDLTESGSFTGSIRLGSKSYPFKGVLRSDLKFDITLSQPGAIPLEVHLELNDERRLTGTIGSTHGEYQLLAEAGDFSASNPAMTAGNYTMQLPTVAPQIGQPEGTGYGLLSVSPTGKVRFTGALGDGRHVSQGAMLYRTGYWPFFAAPYKKGGAMAGLAAYSEAYSSSDWTGDLKWTKNTSSQDITYPNGFQDVSVRLTGSRYTIPAAGERILQVQQSTSNISIVLSGAGLLGTRLTSTLDDRNRIAPSADLYMIIYTSTGEFAANVRLGQQILNFHGMFSRKANFGEGYFIRGDQTGKVVVAPAN